MVLFQIRSLRAPNALVQTSVLRDVQKLVQTDNCILAALSNSVYGLLPVPIGAQVFYLSYYYGDCVGGIISACAIFIIFFHVKLNTIMLLLCYYLYHIRY